MNISLFDKSVDIHQPHHYEQFGGKRHRVFGRRVREGSSRKTEAALTNGGKSTFTSSGVARIPVSRAMLPIFFYAFGSTQRAIGLFGYEDDAPKVLLDNAIGDIEECCNHSPRPFFMGDHAERILHDLTEAHDNGKMSEVKSALNELAETFHQSIEYLFNNGDVAVNWK